MEHKLDSPKLGIDLGTSTVKLILLSGDIVVWRWLGRHHSQVIPTLLQGLRAVPPHDTISIAVTGSNSSALLSVYPALHRVEDLPAIIEGVRGLVPQAGSIIEIGSQGARFITDLDKTAPRFAINEHCAGGTGSFFEDQMSRLDLSIEQYSETVGQAAGVPRLSGRCAVFAKTDIIHRQQEGVPTPDILLGLCYAMIRNYKAAIVRDLPVHTPVAFCGGVTCNAGVSKAIQEVFGLSKENLIIPEQARYVAALGAASQAMGKWGFSELIDTLQTAQAVSKRSVLPSLQLAQNTELTDPAASNIIPAEGVALGIDIGSTSTDLVLVAPDGTLVDFQYLRTAGNPERAVRSGLTAIQKKYGDIAFNAVGVTGSGRERIGRMLGADVVRDEITAQAKGATHWVSQVDTVFEIGGQDSKYISLQNSEVCDFQMNKICAAGTGSFVEEQAARMGIPLDTFGSLALSATAPAELGERCTVFIETAIAGAVAEGVPQADIAAGLCHAIVRNYLHKVVGSKPVGQHIVLQGGVAYNPGIVAAFQQAYGERLTVSPCFSISGAYGVALLASESMLAGEKSHFKGFDFPAVDINNKVLSADVQRNIAFYRQAETLLLDGYDGKLNPKKKTVGIPYVLMIHKFFPMANAFFKSLGYNVLLSDPTDEDTIHLSQQLAQGETCYPVKLIYGHMQKLVDAGVDYIFLPSIHTMKHETSRVAHNYGCVYMQTSAKTVAHALHLQEKGIELLNPVFDLDFGQQAMAGAMIGLGKQLGKPAPLCAKALLSGAMAVRKHGAAVEQQGKILLDTLCPDDKVLVLITRNYGVSDPILNMGIPELLLERGYKVITLSHLPAHDLDISSDHPNLYWPFGQHILSGAKIIAHHPNLYAVYLTNHGCGPDGMLSHLFRQEMGTKPYLQIEVDEHFSRVGVITRIEAFLNGLVHRPTQPLPAGFDMKAVPQRQITLPPWPDGKSTVFVPDFGLYTPYIVQYLLAQGLDAQALPAFNKSMLTLGRTLTNAKEYLPFPALLGQVLAHNGKGQYLVPQTRGAEADGQYARTIRAVLDHNADHRVTVVAPTLETLPNAPQFDLLCRALLTGDLLYTAPADLRCDLEPDCILAWPELVTLASRIGATTIHGQRLAAVGTPLLLTTLNDNILDALEAEGKTIFRAPLTEYLWMLWHDQEESQQWKTQLLKLQAHMAALHKALRERSSFAADPDALLRIADRALPDFAGSNGRYRCAKANQMGSQTSAILHLAPRYENTNMVLELNGLSESCPAPLFQMSLDGDWDESAWSRLRSFLYYCK